MEIFAGTVDGATVSLLAEPVPTGSQCYCFTSQARGDGPGGTTSAVRAIRQRGRRMVTGGSDGLITVTDVKGAEFERFWMNWLPEPVTCLDIAQSGNCCFVGTEGGHIFVIDLARQNLFRMEQRAHRGRILALRIHPERFTVFTVGEDGILCAWHPASKVINYVDQDGPLIQFMEFCPSGDDLALVSESAINVISVESGKSLHQEAFPSRPIAVCWLSETELCYGTEDGYATFLDCAIVGTHLWVKVTAGKMTAMAIDRGRRFLATADDSGQVALYKIESDNIRKLCSVELGGGSVPTCLALVAEKEYGLHRKMREELEKDGYVFSDWD